MLKCNSSSSSNNKVNPLWSDSLLNQCVRIYKIDESKPRDEQSTESQWIKRRRWHRRRRRKQPNKRMSERVNEWMYKHEWTHSHQWHQFNSITWNERVSRDYLSCSLSLCGHTVCRRRLFVLLLLLRLTMKYFFSKFSIGRWGSECWCFFFFTVLDFIDCIRLSFILIKQETEKKTHTNNTNRTQWCSSAFRLCSFFFRSLQMRNTYWPFQFVWVAKI